MLKLLIKEEVFGRNNKTELPIYFDNESMTLADLIQKKVATKVKLMNEEVDNKHINHSFKSIEEQLLNAKNIESRTQKERKRLEDAIYDPERAGYEALTAFQQNAFFVIIDGKQREDLEEKLYLNENSEVRFIKLMPLMGG